MDIVDQRPRSAVTRAFRLLRLLLLAPAVALSLSGCGITDPIVDFRTATENALNDAIAALNNASADWQQVLEELRDELPAEVQSTVRVEVSNLLARGIAQGGVELRCNIDFLRARARQGLQRVRTRFLGGTPPPIEPAFCQFVPIAVERALVPGRIPQLEFYGFDFDQTTNLRVFHVRSNGRLDVTSQLDRPTHYAMTLKFGANGVQLDDRSERFVLEFGGRQVSSVAIIQPPTPVCRTRTDRFQPGPVTLVPRHTRGDRDYKGHGPTSTATVTRIVSLRSISARVHMRAYESNSDNSPKSDHTTAEQTRTFPVYTAPSGFRIDRVLGPSVSSRRYRDSNHTNDSFNMGSGGPVSRFVFVGDTDGNEAGTRTKVDVTFNRMTIELVQTGNCVPERAIMELMDQNLLNESTFEKLESAVKEAAETRAAPVDVQP